MNLGARLSIAFKGRSVTYPTHCMSGTWTEEIVGGHACHLYEPPRRNANGYVILYLHGVHLGRLYDKSGFMSAFDQHGFPVVCPVTQRSWWTDRICPEFDAKISAEQHIVQNVLPFIAEKYKARPPQIGLLGTSMGGQGALRLAYVHPQLFPVAAAISPAIDFHLRWDEGDETLPTMFRDKEQARQHTAILYVNPLNWPRHQFFCCDPADERWFNSAERLQMKLSSMGIPHECDLETSAGGHGFDYYNMLAPKAIGFITQRLDRERLRVV
jgi:S-formylglutathione hydrolase FrmB